MQPAVAGIGLLVLGLVGAGLITLDALVAVPTALFVTVYALCTAAAVRLSTGGARVIAGVACAVVLVILVFSGWALLAVAAVAVPAAVAGRTGGRHRVPTACAGDPLTSAGVEQLRRVGEGQLVRLGHGLADEVPVEGAQAQPQRGIGLGGGGLHGHAPGDLAHRGQQRELAVGGLDGLAGDGVDALVDQELGEAAVGGEVQVGELSSTAPGARASVRP